MLRRKHPHMEESIDLLRANGLKRFIRIPGGDAWAMATMCGQRPNGS